MTRQRIVLLLLAIVLVYVGTITITRIPYQRIYQSITSPKADADDVKEQLRDPDALTRRQGLDAYHFGLQNDSEVLNALTQTVLHDTDQGNRLQALKILTSKTLASMSQHKKQAPLETAAIDQIVSLFGDSSLSPDLLWSLVIFAGSTAQWQTRPQQAIDRITTLLTETAPVAGEEKYAAYAREDKQRSVMQALKGYAHRMMLPDHTLELLLPIYTTVPASRLRPEAGYIFQYHAINGPLPVTVRQAVVDTMMNSDDKNLRLTAIMTMEWIGKQEGRTPPEMLALLKNEDDSWTRSNISHVILRIQMYNQDPLASLLGIVKNTELPDSIRANALREAGKKYSQEQRFKEAVKHLQRADETALRAAAVSLLPDTSEQENDTLAMIDISLRDSDPGIRILAVRKLAAMHVSDSEKISRFEQALADDNEDVVKWSAKTIMNTSLTSTGIKQRLALLEKSGKLESIREKPKPGLWQTIVAAAKDTRHHGLRVYWVLSAAGILMAVGFAVYFVYRMLVFIQEKQRRRVYAVIGVLVVWTGLTYAMVALFVLGAFSFGHNSLVPPKDQLIIDTVAGSALLIYGFIGWLMKKLINRKL